MAVLAVAIYVLLAIGSYSPFDPAWTVAGSDLAVSNQFGRWGAYTADIMLLVFGWPAYLLPASLTGVAVLLLRPSWRDSLSWLTTLIRASGFALMLAATCLLADLHFTGGDFPAGPGGALGKSLADVGLPVLNWIGLTLVAIAVLAMGTQATIGYSWPMIAEYTGRGVHLAMQSLAAGSLVAGRAVHRGVTRLLNGDPLSTLREEPSARARTASTRSRKEPAVGRGQVAERRKPQVEEPVVSGSTGIQRRLFDLKSEGELPDLELLEDFAGGGERRLLEGLPGGDVATAGDQTRGLQSGRGSRLSAAWPGGHALRTAAGARREGQQDQQSGEGLGAFALGGQRAHRRGHSRQVRRRHRNPQ